MLDASLPHLGFVLRSEVLGYAQYALWSHSLVRLALTHIEWLAAVFAVLLVLPIVISMLYREKAKLQERKAMKANQTPLLTVDEITFTKPAEGNVRMCACVCV